MTEYSDYIVYVDESGDHGLKTIDPQYPIFSLAFCIFKKADYIATITPALNALKLKYWGHCDVVFHAHDIRKSMSGDWSILNSPQTRNSFLHDLSTLIQDTPFDVISCVIKKDALMRYPTPKNPYQLAMLFCMERLNNWLLRNGQAVKTLQIQFEARGKTEDAELELEFRRVCDNAAGTVNSGTDFAKIDYRIRFMDKQSNSTGLQIADLVARPIGLKVFRPEQTNQAFDVIKGKLITHPNGDYEGRGLKIFP